MARLDTELSEQILKIGFVDEHFSGLLAPWWGLDGTFIESLKKTHFGDGIFLAASERAAVQLCPSVQCRLLDENFEGECGAAVGGDHVSKFATGTAIPLRTIAFEEVVLIDVAVGCRIALDAADGIGARHGRIIGGATGEVNAGIWGERLSQYETAHFRPVPNQNEVWPG